VISHDFLGGRIGLGLDRVARVWGRWMRPGEPKEVEVKVAGWLWREGDEERRRPRRGSCLVGACLPRPARLHSQARRATNRVPEARPLLESFLPLLLLPSLRESLQPKTFPSREATKHALALTTEQPKKTSQSSYLLYQYFSYPRATEWNCQTTDTRQAALGKPASCYGPQEI
jgi:hypothetical protein